MTTADESPAATNMADDEDAQPEVLLPCGVCSRKFNPRSLDKHVKICERTAARKRKPFDSAKQRIQGTELAEFLPKHEQQQTHHHTQHHHNHHHHNNNESRRASNGGNHTVDRAICRKPNNAWKQTRDEFLKAIRAARGDTQQHPASQSQSHVPSHHQQHQHQHQHQQQTSQTATSQQRPSTLSLVNTTGAPTRPNEKGQCPTCQRQFGVKSYERHVAFCRERATRLPASPQTSNVAKERLEARMKYRAPALKNRRPTNREKYSPGAHKAVVNQSPLLARTTAKETIHAAPATTPASAQKNADTASPKLPMLKRPVQSSKESPVTNSGPLKSRPMDRSNRQSLSDSQESLNPPALRQIFASRRLLLLTDVLPSKIMPAKSSVSSISSRKSDCKLFSRFLKKGECVNSPIKSPENTDRKPKKKLRLKPRVHRKIEVEAEVEEKMIVTEQYEEEGVGEVKRDFVTWKQIRESNEIESIDKEEEPILSDVTGLSSFEEGNSTTDEFEYNERMVRRMETKTCVSIESTSNKLQAMHKQVLNSARNSNCDKLDLMIDASLNNTYDIDGATRLETLLLRNEDSLDTINSDDKSIGCIGDFEDDEDDDDDDDDGLSSASTKTFSKSDLKCTEIEYVDSLNVCQAQQQIDSLELNENNAETPRLPEVQRNDEEYGLYVEKNNDPLDMSKQIRERLLTRPKKYYSMPNIADIKVQGTPRIGGSMNVKVEFPKHEEEIDDGTPRNDSERTITPRNTDPFGKNNERCTNRRCATYVIDDSSRNLTTTNHQQQQQQHPNDESSEEKPLKKRRKLQQQQQQHQQHQQHQQQYKPGTSKNEPAHQLHRRESITIKNLPEIQFSTTTTTTTATTKNSSNVKVAPRQSYVVFDYYRNEAANFSDVSSVRTDDQMLEFYEDFADENESNASELIKEIDVCFINSDMQDVYGNFTSDCEDSLGEMTSRMTSIDLMNRRPKTDGRTRNNRRNSSYMDKNEETSIATIELTDLSKHCSDKATQHFEKEICTITRLDSINRDNPYFPNISDRSSTRAQDWTTRQEYRREKLLKSKPQSLRGIIEIDTPRDIENDVDEEDDEESKKVCHSKKRLAPNIRRLVHSERRSGVGKDYNPFLLAEQQLNDLFSDTSDQSSTDGSLICPPQKPNSSPNFPLSHSSAFVKYPNNTNSQQQQQQQQQQSQQTTSDKQQRISLIAPPTGFDDLTSSDLSSDCTETNSLSREFLTSSSNSNSLAGSRVQMINNAEQREHVLGRRVIIDQSQALGGGEFAPERSSTNQQTKLTNGSNTNTNGLNSRVARPVNNTNCNRSNSMRSSSAPKPPERKISSSSSSGSSDFSRNNKLSNAKTNKNSSSNDVENQQQRGDNNYKNLNGSNLSLSSIISSTDMEMKRSNSLFDELLSSFEEDVNSSSTLPSLMSLMRNDPTVSFLSSSTPQQNGVNGHHQRGTNNGRINCSDDDEDLSSPESVKRQECGGKLSADSAYSSLNRKYSNHERSTNDVSSGKFKLSKFCHECGFKFPDSAKFCCECGVKRLTL